MFFDRSFVPGMVRTIVTEDGAGSGSDDSGANGDNAAENGANGGAGANAGAGEGRRSEVSFSQSEVDALIKARLERARSSWESKHAAADDGAKTELAGRVKELEDKLASAERERTVLEVSTETGVPAALFDGYEFGTRDELVAKAKSLSAFRGEHSSGGDDDRVNAAGRALSAAFENASKPKAGAALRGMGESDYAAIMKAFGIK